jgi:bifunctional DNase/RNase
MVEMELREIHISQVTAHQIVILEEKDGDRSFPIYIGMWEAHAADDAVRQRQHLRPMTHDLILNTIEGLGAELEGVLVDSLAEDTFHGKLLVRTASGSHIKIDSRPSDAIVLASRQRVPIFVSEEVLERTSPDGE